MTGFCTLFRTDSKSFPPKATWLPSFEFRKSKFHASCPGLPCTPCDHTVSCSSTLPHALHTRWPCLGAPCMRAASDGWVGHTGPMHPGPSRPTSGGCAGCPVAAARTETETGSQVFGFRTHLALYSTPGTFSLTAAYISGSILVASAILCTCNSPCCSGSHICAMQHMQTASLSET